MAILHHMLHILMLIHHYNHRRYHHSYLRMAPRTDVHK